jgi:hypothetical protein
VLGLMPKHGIEIHWRVERELLDQIGPDPTFSQVLLVRRAARTICHDDDEIAVLDNLTEIKSPFNPTAATAQMATALKEYGLSEVTGDRYSAGWVVDAFAKLGVRYVHSERDRSAGYLDCLPLFMSGRVRLIDNPRLVAQFAALERRTTSIRDKVDHGPGGRDDCCNAAALALSGRPSGYLDYDLWVGGPVESEKPVF